MFNIFPNIYLLLNAFGEEDFPSGPVVKNPPHNARIVGSIPGQGTGIAQATEQLSPPKHSKRVPAQQQKISHDTVKFLQLRSEAAK